MHSTAYNKLLICFSRTPTIVEHRRGDKASQYKAGHDQWWIVFKVPYDDCDKGYALKLAQ